MSYKNIYALILFAHLVSTHAASSADTTIITNQEELTVEPQTPSQDAYTNPSPEVLRADKEFCLKTLSDENSDINALSPSGKTPLQLLVLYFINNFSTERLMALALKRGADVNVCDEQGRTPLIFITAYTLCPKVFEEKQTTVDASSTSENTTKQTAAETPKAQRNPLHDRATSLAVMELLLAFNADPTATDKDDISPLLLAVTTGDQEVVELFARYGLLEKIFQEIVVEEALAPTTESANSPEETTTTL